MWRPIIGGAAIVAAVGRERAAYRWPVVFGRPASGPDDEARAERNPIDAVRLVVGLLLLLPELLLSASRGARLGQRGRRGRRLEHLLAGVSGGERPDGLLLGGRRGAVALLFVDAILSVPSEQPEDEHRRDWLL